MKNKKWLSLFFLLVCFIVCGMIFSCRADHIKEDEIILTDDERETGDPDDTNDADHENRNEKQTNRESIPEKAPLICIYICGCVKNAGVYYLDEGARTIDAVNAAGGLNDEAASEYINLAAPLSDGDMIYIPHASEIDETEGAGKAVSGIQNAFDVNASGANVSDINVSSVADGIIDINKASKDELKGLPGIGDVKADAIISYREQTGGFTSVEDIMNVSGIGQASFEKIKEYIKV